MNFPPDVISRAIVIAEELRRKLPERPNQSNVNNSSLNKRSTYRSTLLETSTSEHSHLLRLFYNLYADMVSINRLPITMDEKTELLNKKMRELAEDLPLHILEMAKNGTLFEIFKRSPNLPTNIWTPPEQSIIEEEPPRAQTPPLVDASQSFASHNATDFSLLSQDSIARRIGLELQDTSISQASSSTQVSQKRNKPPGQQQSKVQFLADSVEEIPSHQSLDECFTNTRFNSDRDAASFKFDDIDNNFDFMDESIDFIDHELTQYFSNMSPKQAAVNFEDDPNISDFLIPDIFDKNGRFTSISDKPRSNQNTSTEAQAATSSKDYTKTKSTNIHTSHKSSSSSSSGLFRLQLKSPLNVKDNRILKTPPKSARVQNARVQDEYTFSNLKDTTERRSTSRPSFSQFNGNDFSEVEIPTFSSKRNSGEFTGEEIPTIEFSDITENLSDSPSQSFELNLSQFCSREPAEDEFFFSTQDFQTDRFFAELSDDITPLPSTTQFCGNVDTTLQDESFAFSNISQTSAKKTKTYQYPITDALSVERNTPSQLNDVSYMSTSQEPSQNFFNLNSASHDFSQKTKGQAPYEENQASYIRKVTLAPKITPPTALQFLQYAYNNESDNDSTDDEELQGKAMKPSARKEEPAKIVTNDRNKMEQGYAERSERRFPRIDSSTVTGQQKSFTESFNISTANIENVEDIILPAPPQFL